MKQLKTLFAFVAVVTFSSMALAQTTAAPSAPAQTAAASAPAMISASTGAVTAVDTTKNTLSVFNDANKNGKVDAGEVKAFTYSDSTPITFADGKIATEADLAAALNNKTETVTVDTATAGSR